MLHFLTVTGLQSLTLWCGGEHICNAMFPALSALSALTALQFMADCVPYQVWSAVASMRKLACLTLSCGQARHRRSVAPGNVYQTTQQQENWSHVLAQTLPSLTQLTVRHLL